MAYKDKKSGASSLKILLFVIPQNFTQKKPHLKNNSKGGIHLWLQPLVTEMMLCSITLQFI